MTLVIDRLDGLVKTNYWEYHGKNCIGIPTNMNNDTWKCTYGLTDFNYDGCGLEAIVKCSNYYTCQICLTAVDGGSVFYAQAWCEDHDPRIFKVL